jgi:hypothetical protein
MEINNKEICKKKIIFFGVRSVNSNEGFLFPDVFQFHLERAAFIDVYRIFL